MYLAVAPERVTAARAGCEMKKDKVLGQGTVGKAWFNDVRAPTRGHKNRPKKIAPIEAMRKLKKKKKKKRARRRHRWQQRPTRGVHLIPVLGLR